MRLTHSRWALSHPRNSGEVPTLADQVEKERLKALGDKIEAAKKATQPKRSKKEEHHTAVQTGWRMVIELVAGILIGFGIGFGLDTLFGTMPIFLVLFILLGFIAGVRTMLRSAKELQEEHAAIVANDERK